MGSAVKISDIRWIVSEPGRTWAHDAFATQEAADACADRIELETGKRYHVEAVDAFMERTTREQLEAAPLVEITADFYERQLNCLPPMHRAGAWGWFMCEYESGSLTHQYVKHRGRFYTALVDMANRATWITPERVESLPPGSPLFAWFGRVALARREMHAGDLTAGTGEGVGFYLEPHWSDPPREPFTAGARPVYLGDLMQWGEPASLGARLEGF